MSTRDYSSINTMKKFAMDELAPKYFNMDTTNDLNIGLLGYVTELLGTISEDSFNTITNYMNEMFPNLATIPETLHNYGAMFKLNTIFATAAECDFILLIAEDHILEFATESKTSKGVFEFYLDNDMIIDVEGIPFRPDYTIKISFKRYNGNIVYNAKYEMVEYDGIYTNTISNLTDPYIRFKNINFENTKYLQLEIKAHQVTKYSINNNVVESTIINLPKYNIEFDNHLANFEVFYKEPNSNIFTQLENKMIGTPPSVKPFCYYKIIEDNKIEISFTSRDNYFQPTYNSEININYYTTLGSSGNFTEYTGNKITVNCSSTKYSYNNSNIAVFAIPLATSKNGSNPMDLEQLRNEVVTRFSTVNSITTENDLQLFFKDFNLTFNSNILFLKKRDDVFERLFSAFILLKNSNNEIYSTNTLNIELKKSDFEISATNNDTYVIKPGKVFKYKDGIIDTLIPYEKTLFELNDNENNFLYSNPFLIFISKSPLHTGYYLNTCNSSYKLDHEYINDISLVQFISGILKVERDAVSGSNKYKISIKILPSTALDNPIIAQLIDPDTNEIIEEKDSGSVSLKLYIDSSGTKSAYYIDMHLDSWDLLTDTYTYSCELETDDYMMINGSTDLFRVFNVYETENNELKQQALIPMINSIVHIEISYRYLNNPDTPVITNIYNTETNPITFINPIKLIRSNTKFISNRDGVIGPDGVETGNTFNIIISSVPVVNSQLLLNNSLYDELFNDISTQYDYINKSINLLTNNYGIDVKFYNTYGKSKNFKIGDNGERFLDKVNISIKFKVHPVFGVDETEFVRDIKLFIKNYIENINISGTNTIYISNLIRQLENNFNKIEYLKFVGINNYNTDMQSIINTTVDLNSLTKSDRINYIPEYLTIKLDDINIEIF